MEQQAGMVTVYNNWRREVSETAGVVPTWVPITYWRQGGLLERLPFVPAQARAVFRSYQETRRALTGPLDAVLFNTFNPAVIHRSAVRRYRSFLMFDVTPVQYDAMAHWYGHRPDNGGRLADLKRRRVKQVFQEAGGLLAWSRWTAASAIEEYGADPARVHIVPPGVDTSLWTPRPDARPDDGVVRILFIGGDFERKGGDMLLRWIAETDRKNVELHLVTRARIDSGERIFVYNGLGSNAPGLVALAQRSDLFVLPTRADCFSIASLEAMAAGLPVIATNVGGISDIVRSGETGLLIEPDSYPGLCEAVESLVDSAETRERFGRRGREVVCDEFDVGALVRRGLGIIRAGK